MKSWQSRAGKRAGAWSRVVPSALALVACAQHGAPPPSALPPAPLVDPKGHPWLAPAADPATPSLTQGSAERRLVLARTAGSELFAIDPFALRLRVEPEQLTLADTCSSVVLGYRVTGGLLRSHELPQPPSAQRPCSQASGARVAWLAALLRSAPQVELTAGGLAFTGSAGGAWFEDEPRYPLVGTSWLLIGCSKLGVAGASCAGEPLGQLILASDGSFEASFPCGSLRGSHGASDEGVSFTAGSFTPHACTSAHAKPSTELLKALLASGPFEVAEREGALSLSNATGRVFARAAAAPVRSTLDFAEPPAALRRTLE